MNYKLTINLNKREIKQIEEIAKDTGVSVASLTANFIRRRICRQYLMIEHDNDLAYMAYARSQS